MNPLRTIERRRRECRRARRLTNRPPRPRARSDRRDLRRRAIEALLPATTLRDRLRRLRRGTTDRRLDDLRDFLALGRAARRAFRIARAFLTPPCLLTVRCHQLSFRPRRRPALRTLLRRCFFGGLSIASHAGILHLHEKDQPRMKSVIRDLPRIFVTISPLPASAMSGIVSHLCFQAPPRFTPLGMM
jgi:hypothetical protein